MKISILTMFPELFDSFFKLPLVDRAVKKEIVTIDIIDIKPYAGGSFRHIDDSPCGGGVGMILRFDTIMKALEAVRKAEKRDSNRVILLSPKGQVYSQTKARELAAQENLVLICGHYEGVDRRVENHVDEMISIGDYILSGGETAAEVIVDSIVRLLDGVIRQGATKEESHEKVLLEYPQYTKPVEYLGERVPDILLSGNHGAIDKWRHLEALKDTKRLRPDLFEKYPLSEEERKALDSEC